MANKFTPDGNKASAIGVLSIELSSVVLLSLMVLVLLYCPLVCKSPVAVLMDRNLFNKLVSLVLLVSYGKIFEEVLSILLCIL